MKEWFKYEFGYVNIDDENIYLTNTGNWSETKTLSEKTKAVQKKNDNKGSRMIAFLFVVICMFAFLIFKSIINGKIGIMLIFLTTFGGYRLYEYLKTEIGDKFRIPFNKITDISQAEKSFTITFTNGEGESDSYTITYAEAKAVEIMARLKELVG